MATEQLIWKLVIASTVLLLLFCVFFLAFIFLYRKRLARKHHAYLARVLTEQESFMNAESKYLHDHIGQRMYLLQLELFQLQDNKDHIEQSSIQWMIDLLKEIKADTRDIAYSLNQEHLKKIALADAMATEIEGANRKSGVAAFLQVHGEPVKLSSQTEIMVYRIAQEAIRNALKHSKASTIHAKLHYDAASLQLIIVDNGDGFDSEAQQQKGMGLANMRHRATLMGGELSLFSKPGQGVIIALTLPYKQDKTQTTPQ